MVMPKHKFNELLLLTVLGFSHSPLLLAEEPVAKHLEQDPKAPDPLSWASRILLPTGSAMIRRVVILREEPKDDSDLLFPAIDQSALSQMIYTDFASTDDAAWADKINRRKSLSAKDPRYRLKVLLQATGSQALLIWPEPGSNHDLMLQRPSDQGDFETIARTPQKAKSADEAKDLAAQLREVLGYDGIVLAQEGQYVLAQSADLSHSGQLLYGTAIADSTTKLILSGASTEPSAFLRLARSGGHYSVWRLVSTTASGPLLPATKLQIESRSRPESSPANVNEQGPQTERVAEPAE